MSSYIDTTASRYDPLRGYKFSVFDQEGEIDSGFTKVSGLSDNTEVRSYQDGSDPVTPWKFPGTTQFSNVSLQRGLSLGTSLLKWRNRAIIAGLGLFSASGGILSNNDSVGESTSDFRKTIVIQLYDRGSIKILKEWQLLDAWACGLDEGELDATSSEVVIESLEICHEGIIRTITGIPENIEPKTKSGSFSFGVSPFGNFPET